MKTFNYFVMIFLLNAVWQIAVITVVAIICNRFLRKISAKHQHFLGNGTFNLRVASFMATYQGDGC